MASWNQWALALQSAGISGPLVSNTSTVETYSHIRSLGLNTVEWLSFSPVDTAQIKPMLAEIQKFLEKKSPCLFIFEPLERGKESGLKKDYLFGVQEFSAVLDWVEKNQRHLLHYSYLVTTQITNPADGFVGSVFSNGSGDLVCETLHRKGVSNQRELSQAGKNLGKELDFFTAHDFELVSHRAHFLPYDRIRKIVREFSHLNGYFEFVYGRHLGKAGIFVTGFMPLSANHFPVSLWENEFYRLSSRCNAVWKKNS